MSENVVTLCETCHENRHNEAQSWMGNEEDNHVSKYDYIRCGHCRISFHHPKYNMCYSCHEKFFGEEYG